MGLRRQQSTQSGEQPEELCAPGAREAAGGSVPQRRGRINPGFPGGAEVKNPPANAGDTGDAGIAGSIPGWESPLEEEMATQSSALAWRIPRTEEPGGLQSLGSQRVGRDCD